MYSHEIQEYLDKNNHELTPLEFMGIINTSPQIHEVLYNPQNNFKIKTTDNFTMDFKLLEKPKALKLKKEQ